MAKKKRVKRRVRPGCLVSILIIAVSCIILFLTPVFDIREIVITGNSRVTNDEILIASGIREDKNIFATSMGYAKKKIKALGYIEDVKITRSLPGRVNIKITEGTVAAYLDYGELLIGINKDGQTLCITDKASEPNDAPRVVGMSAENGVIGKIVEPVEGSVRRFEILLKFLNTFYERGLTGDITEIDVTETDYIVFRHLDKLKVEFGELNDYELKFNYLDAMLADMGKNVEGVFNMTSENYAYSHTIE